MPPGAFESLSAQGQPVPPPYRARPCREHLATLSRPAQGRTATSAAPCSLPPWREAVMARARRERHQAVLGRDREDRYGEEILQKAPAPDLIPGICDETLDQGWDTGRIGRADGLRHALAATFRLRMAPSRGSSWLLTAPLSRSPAGDLR